jgi:hypothetical protein
MTDWLGELSLSVPFRAGGVSCPFRALLCLDPLVSKNLVFDYVESKHASVRLVFNISLCQILKKNQEAVDI